jgi:hypothetical protein
MVKSSYTGPKIASRYQWMKIKFLLSCLPNKIFFPDSFFPWLPHKSIFFQTIKM